MVLILIFVLTFFVILLSLLIYFQAKHPKNIYLTAAREWQTSIGAVIGFLAVASIYVLGVSVEKKRDIEQKKHAEISYLKTTYYDLDALIGIQNEQTNYLKKEIDFANNNLVCFYNLQRLQADPDIPFTLKGQLSTIITKISPSSYSLISRAENAIIRYEVSIRAFDPNSCMTNPEKVSEALISVRESWNGSFSEIRKQVYQELILKGGIEGEDLIALDHKIKNDSP